MTILARDPSVLDPATGHMLRAVVDVPASRLDLGPRGPRFYVIDFDASEESLHDPLDLAPNPEPAPGWGYHDAFAGRPDADLLTNPGFRAQNVYAIAARTLATFEAALGRPVPWAFPNSQLNLVPAAFAEANAYYSREDQALYFGYFKAPRNELVRTSLAHDIVAHETTHAILDGLRRRFDVPGMPDQAGFHEGFADVVALLSILAVPESIGALVGRPSDGSLSSDELTIEALRGSVLFTIGRQFGDAVHETRGGGLRRSIEITPTNEWLRPHNREWQEPHRRGEIFAAMVMQAFLGVWTARLAPILGPAVDRGRVVEEGARAARHLLEMCIRAIDYCPPIDFDYADFLAALLASDKEVSPDDPHQYRQAVIDAFGAFGLRASALKSVRIKLKEWPSYRSFSYAALRSDPDEAFRFVWENVGLLSVDQRFYLNIENVRPSVRVGPRGFVVAETVVDYVQELILSAAEFNAICASEAPAIKAPSSIPSGTQLKLWGGGTIIFDEFGALKYQHAKPLADWRRQAARLAYLVDRGWWDTKGRIGFSYGDSLGERFVALHASGDNPDETW
ncbi:MAG: hypothetical protein H0U52_01665 [Chloroflexi bacterium]|nr:hypothetical protein [Chloroflexota bacterium]